MAVNQLKKCLPLIYCVHVSLFMTHVWLCAAHLKLKNELKGKDSLSRLPGLGLDQLDCSHFDTSDVRSLAWLWCAYRVSLQSTCLFYPSSSAGSSQKFSCSQRPHAKPAFVERPTSLYSFHLMIILMKIFEVSATCLPGWMQNVLFTCLLCVCVCRNEQASGLLI